MWCRDICWFGHFPKTLTEAIQLLLTDVFWECILNCPNMTSWCAKTKIHMSYANSALTVRSRCGKTIGNQQKFLIYWRSIVHSWSTRLMASTPRSLPFFSLFLPSKLFFFSFLTYNYHLFEFSSIFQYYEAVFDSRCSDLNCLLRLRTSLQKPDEDSGKAADVDDERVLCGKGLVQIPSASRNSFCFVRWIKWPALAVTCVCARFMVWIMISYSWR